MKVTPVKDTILVDDILAKSNKERVGIHLSDLDYCLKKSYYRKLHPQPITEKQGIMFAIGYGVQNYLYDEKEVLIIVDEICCSPDYYKGIEIKTTRAGMKAFDPCKPQWLMRMMGYCKALGITEYLLSVIFVIPADIKSWRFSFTESEIEANWRQVLKRKEILETAFSFEIPPLIDYHQPWECKLCSYSGYCLNGLGKMV